MINKNNLLHIIIICKLVHDDLKEDSDWLPECYEFCNTGSSDGPFTI